jgi:hypothetical protein
MLPEAMEVLKAVATTYDTDLARGAVKTALLLIRQAGERKCEDLTVLDVLGQNSEGESIRPTESFGLAPYTNHFNGLTDEELNWAQFFSSNILME